jgi:hypothetical protein
MPDGTYGRFRALLGNPWLRGLVLLVLVTGGAWALASRGDLGVVLGRIVDADPVMLAAAVAVYAVSWPLRGLRYRDVLAGSGHVIDGSGATAAVFVSQTANLVAPLRSGDLSRAYLVREHWGVPYRAGTASLVVERTLDLGAVALLGAIGAVPLAGAVAGATGRARAVLLAAGVAAGGALVAVTVMYRGWGRGFVRWSDGGPLRPLGLFVEEVLDAFASTGRSRGVWSQSVGIWSLEVATALAVTLALGVTPVPALMPAMLLAVSAGNLAKIVPLTPGGVGLYEAAFAAVAATVLPIGVPVAVAVAVVDHGLKNGFTLVGGTVSAASLHVSLFADSGE